MPFDYDLLLDFIRTQPGMIDKLRRMHRRDDGGWCRDCGAGWPCQYVRWADDAAQHRPRA